jgi:serine/threonine protein kinase
MAGFSHFVRSFARSVGEVIFDLETDGRGQEGAETGGELPVAVDSPQRTYNLLGRLAVGDVADVYRAVAAESPYVVKVSRLPEGGGLLDHERKVLTSLLCRADGTTYRKYLPGLVESFPVADAVPRRVNVFQYEPGFYTLEQVHEQHPALDGRHLAWIFNRLLTVLGFSHRQGIVHGTILPCHVLLHAADHGLQLVGWGQSVETFRRITSIPTRYRDWYPLEVLNKHPASPATDLFLAARSLIYLAGGGPACDRMPDAVPAALRRFVEACLLEGEAMRPRDAWQLMDEFNELLRRLYGPPMFHPLTMT